MLKSLSIYAFCFALALTGCTSAKYPISSGKIKQSQASASCTYNHPHQLIVHHKSPYGGVALYPQKSSIKRPYRVIGKETVSLYNFIGLERQNDAVDDLLRKVATSMGGDAIINITQDDQKIEGTVISYERVML